MSSAPAFSVQAWTEVPNELDRLARDPLIKWPSVGLHKRVKKVFFLYWECTCERERERGKTSCTAIRHLQCMYACVQIWLQCRQQSTTVPESQHGWRRWKSIQNIRTSSWSCAGPALMLWCIFPPNFRPGLDMEWTLGLWGLRESLNMQSFLTTLLILQALFFCSNRHGNLTCTVIWAHFALLFSLFYFLCFTVSGSFCILYFVSISSTGLWC